MNSCQIKSFGLTALAAGLFGLSASAAATTVLASADLFNAVAPNTYDGTNPLAIDVTGIASFTISNVSTAALTYNSGGNFNDADGIGSASSIFSTGASGLSGVTAPNAGFLSGVFLGATVSPTTPPALNYMTTGTGFTQSFAALQQTFFIGDGLTGDGTGTTQTFYVPAGATKLYLGFIDACSYSGSPSCYFDNSGSVTFTLNTVAAVPEPETVALLLAGLGCVGEVARRRNRLS